MKIGRGGDMGVVGRKLSLERPPGGLGTTATWYRRNRDNWGTGDSTPYQSPSSFNDFKTVDTGYSQDAGREGGTITIGDKVVASGSGGVFCYNISDLSLVWDTKVMGQDSYNVPCQPTYDSDGGYIFVQNSNSEMFCLDPDTGDIIWRTQVNSSSDMMTLDPVVSGDIVIGGADHGPAAAFDKHTGDLLWTTTFSGQVSAPIIADGNVVFIHVYGDSTSQGKDVEAYNVSDGSSVWDTALVYREAGSTLFDGHHMMPTYDGETLYVAVSDVENDAGSTPVGRLYAVDPTDGSVPAYEDWPDTFNAQYSTSSTAATAQTGPSVDDGYIYLSGAGTTNSENATLRKVTKDYTQWSNDVTQDEEWSYTMHKAAINSPTITDEHVFMMDGQMDGTTTDMVGYVYCLDKSNGGRLWSVFSNNLSSTDAENYPFANVIPVEGGDSVTIDLRSGELVKINP